MSYSGRCLLSAFLNGRSANLGDCSQPCRWEYSLLEKSRPEETFSMEEDERGTYIFNSRDLNLLKRIEEIKFAGVDSIKIEGRMKSLYYVANVTRIYREGLDSLNHKATGLSDLFEELDRVSHRPYCEGFADGLNSMQTQYYGNSSYIRNYQYLGDVIGNSQGRIRIQVKAKFSLGEEIEIIFPHREKDCKFTVEEIFDEDETGISFTKPNTVVSLACGVKMPEYGIIRKKIR